MNKKRTTICIITSLAAWAVPTFSIAQAATGADAAEIPEIVVTAQKREERLSDVGMAITAVTGATLVERGVLNVEDLVKIEPSLQYSESNNGLPVYTIRGVGFYDQSLASASTVSLYLNEAPYAFPALSKGALLDVERVEVLKGPQGTLYGQNATGGAINFVAAEPSNTFSAGLDETYGRFNANSFGGFVSGALSDTLTARFAARIDEGGAWQKSDSRDDRLGDKDFKTARLLLNWTPSDTFAAKLNLNGFTDDSESQAAQQEGFRFGAPQYISTLTPAYLAANPLAYLPNAADYPNYPAAVKAQLANAPAPNDDRAADWLAGTHPKNHERYEEGTLRLDYDPSNQYGFTSLTKHELYSENNTQDLSGLNVLETLPFIHGEVHSVYQELRAHGRLMDNRIDWLAGVNYSDDIGYENDAVQDSYTGTYLTGGGIGSLLPGTPFHFFGVNHDSDTKAKSVFANLNYHVTDSINIHGGVRYTESTEESASCTYLRDENLIQFNAGLSSLLTGTAQPVPPPGGCVTFLPDNTLGKYATRLDEHNVPWRVGLDWKPAASSLVYATVSEGFKAGGSPALGASSYVQLKPVVQEQLRAYEIGSKSELLNRSLAIESAFFYYDYKNKQFLGRTLDPLGVFGALQSLVNIPKSKEIGAELSATWRPISGVTLNAAGTYLDSKVVSDFTNYGPYIASVGDTINLKGEAFPYTPKWSLSVGARYDWPLTEQWLGFVSGNATYQTATVAAFGAQQAAAVGPSFYIGSYGLLDLAAGVISTDKRWTIQLWGKNVANKYYWNNVFYEYDNTVRYAGMPATYGITVNFRY